MSQLDKFVRIVADTFPDDRLTYQRSIPTFHPNQLSEAVQLIELAKTNGQKLYITGFGNNIDPLGSNFDNLMVLRSDCLGQLLEVNESNLTVVVGAGFPLREINVKLESFGLFLPIGELSYVGSVAGAISVGLSAELAASHWEQRADISKNVDQPLAPQISIDRYLLRLDVATPTGEAKSYGVATSKQPHQENFARVYSPSWGLLGFIASAKFRVAPIAAKEEYQDMRQAEISHRQFIEASSDSETAGAKAQYFSQLRKKLDPAELFPIITNGL